MKDLKKFIKTTIQEFLNEQANNYITVYHGGYMDKLYSPIHLTEDYYMAKSYDDNVYTFLMDKNSNFLDLTDLKTFQEIKKKIYDNNSKNYLKYKTYGGFGFETKSSVDRDYKILSKYENYEEILKRYNELLNDVFIKTYWEEDMSDRFDNIKEIPKELYKDKKDIIMELETLNSEIINMNKQDDYSLNMFGDYFIDYSKNNGYDGYKAISTYLDGKTKGIEYCIININTLKRK